MFPGNSQNPQATNQKNHTSSRVGLEQVIYHHCPICLLFSVDIDTKGLKFAKPLFHH